MITESLTRRASTLTESLTRRSNTVAGSLTLNSSIVADSFTTEFTIINGVAEPTVQPSNLSFTSVSSSQITLNWTNGDGTNVIWLRSTSAITDVPVDPTDYSVGDTIGSCTVEYLGSGTSFTDAGLSAFTTYYYAGFSVNGASGTWNFLTTAPLTGSQLTLYAFNNALHFDGSNDVVASTSTSFLSDRSTYTVCGWVKFDTTGTDQLIWGYTNNRSDRGVGLLYVTATGRLRCMNSPAGTGSGYLETPLATPTAWHHVGYTYDVAGGAGNTDKMKIYIDGSLIASPTSVGTIQATGVFSGTTKFGASVSSRFLDGVVDEWAMWSDANATHITNHYNSGNGATPDASNLIMDCRFNESNNSATTTDETGTNIFTLTSFDYIEGSRFESH